MKSSFFIFPFILLLTFGCGESEDSLVEDPTIQSSFTEEEIEELQHIYNWFNKEICRDSNEEIAACYKAYLGNLLTSIDESGNLELNLSYETLKKKLSEMDSSTFNEIWTVGFIPKKGTDEFKHSISLRPDGKFAQFLINAGRENPTIHLYAQQFIEAGTVSPNLFGQVLFEYEKYNLKDIRSRLLLAIHYATFVDNAYRNETVTPPKDALPVLSLVSLNSNTFL